MKARRLFLVAGSACVAVAYVERRPKFSEFLTIRSGKLEVWTNWLSPFHPSVPYLWIGLAIACVLAAAVARFGARGAAALGLVALPCLVLAFAFRHAALQMSIEGAYFNRSVGAPAYAGFFRGSWFNPFEPNNPYLWLGLALGSLFGCAILAFAPGLARRRRPRRAAAPSL